MGAITLPFRDRRADPFELLYRAHVGHVYRYAYAITGNQADAEDVTQTTFMNAYRAYERGDRPAAPHNWLIAIAHNVCRQRFRQRARRPTEVAYAEDVSEALVPSDDTPSAADIRRALGHLALNQREALVMRELEGRSYPEIAELLGISESAVETLLFRARRALREQLEGSLTCSQAEAALSLQLDARLPAAEAGQLRAHLRECEACRHLARRQRAQRKGFGALALVPLPPSLGHVFGSGGGTAAGAGIAAKVAAVVVGATVVGGGGYSIARHELSSRGHAAASRPANLLRAVEPAALQTKTSRRARPSAKLPRTTTKAPRTKTKAQTGAPAAASAHNTPTGKDTSAGTGTSGGGSTDTSRPAPSHPTPASVSPAQPQHPLKHPRQHPQKQSARATRQGRTTGHAKQTTPPAMGTTAHTPQVEPSLGRSAHPAAPALPSTALACGLETHQPCPPQASGKGPAPNGRP